MSRFGPSHLTGSTHGCPGRLTGAHQPIDGCRGRLPAVAQASSLLHRQSGDAPGFRPSRNDRYEATSWQMCSRFPEFHIRPPRIPFALPRQIQRQDVELRESGCRAARQHPFPPGRAARHSTAPPGVMGSPPVRVPGLSLTVSTGPREPGFRSKTQTSRQAITRAKISRVRTRIHQFQPGSAAT